MRVLNEDFNEMPTKEEILDAERKLSESGEIYTYVAEDKDGDAFLIVDSWADIARLANALGYEQRDKYDDSFLDNIDWGFSDEYSTCDQCGVVIHTEPDSYSWVPDFFVSDYGIICGDCVRANPEDYLETLYNNPKRANTILDRSQLENLGFELIEDDYQNGWYDREDSPSEILDKAMEKYPYGTFIFNISGQGQWHTNFELWGAYLEEVDEE